MHMFFVRRVNASEVGPGPNRQLLSSLAIALLLITQPAAADLWYEHYSNAEVAIEKQDWTTAVKEINAALERKGDSGARVRSYGMNVTSYFPYFKLGIAYYHLGKLDAALQAFETETRLGAIAESEKENAELQRYRDLVQQAQSAAAAREQEKIRLIVSQGLDEAAELESRGLLNEAIAALDRALAVAPDNAETQELMNELRMQAAQIDRQQQRERKVAELVEDGRALLREGQYDEASSLFREALFLQPSVEIEKLLETTQRNLRARLESGRTVAEAGPAITTGLTEVRTLEAAGRLDTALDRLQSVLALEPFNQEAQSIQERILRTKAERTRRETIEQLLSEAGARLDAGAAEAALAAANRVLALEPGNNAALDYIARAYGKISTELLGSGPGGNIPPAVRFVDLRHEADDGALVQEITTPDFRLNGVIIDNSPVKLSFYGDHDMVLRPDVSSQPLGDFYLTEFNIGATLPPGPSTFRIVATDPENMSSSSEYVVFYARPFFRAPWFYALLLGSVAIAVAALQWRRSRYRQQLRKRRFNPYVAGAPVLEEDMFFGRDDLVERILQTIHNNSLLIYGERRIGKTSIQHQLKKRLRALDDPHYEFYPVYVDLQGTPETRFFQTIAEDVFQELAPVLLDGREAGQDMPENYSHRDFSRDIRAVLKTLQARTKKKVKLVLLIDEVDELNAYDPRINQKLRSLFMKNFAENLVAVVSGVEIKKHWEREGSPWYNFFEEIEVKPLGPQDARELIERPISGIFKLENGVVERIISLTAGRPYLIQKLCVTLVTRLHEQRRKRITVEDVEQIARPGAA